MEFCKTQLTVVTIQQLRRLLEGSEELLSPQFESAGGGELTLVLVEVALSLLEAFADFLEF